MGYEPELNDPVFYENEGEPEPTRCFRCSDELDEEEIVWADVEGLWQVRGKEGNDTAWCAACISKEGESNE
jgi:hypothetical protein